MRSKRTTQWGDRMKKAFVSLVAVAALAASAGGASVAAAQTGPDANGDVNSNCQTGSKFLGAGGNDRSKLHGNGEAEDCQAAPVIPAAPRGAPTPAAAAGAPARAPAVTAGAAAPVVSAPRVTG